jgi:hypothetical protein
MLFYPPLNEYTKKGLINCCAFWGAVMYRQSDIERCLTQINYGGPNFAHQSNFTYLQGCPLRKRYPMRGITPKRKNSPVKPPCNGGLPLIQKVESDPSAAVYEI